MNERQKWERSTRRVHFVCGAVVGGMLGAGVGRDWFSGGLWWARVLAVALPAVFVGCLAYAYLDEFWHRFLRWFR